MAVRQPAPFAIAADISFLGPLGPTIIESGSHAKLPYNNSEGSQRSSCNVSVERSGVDDRNGEPANCHTRAASPKDDCTGT